MKQEENISLVCPNCDNNKFYREYKEVVEIYKSSEGTITDDYIKGDVISLSCVWCGLLVDDDSLKEQTIKESE